MPQALSKALSEDELLYLRLQFKLLEPRDGFVSLDNFRTVRYLLFADLPASSKYGDMSKSRTLAHVALC